jgi:amino acid adenylation domain-containing protein
MHQEGRFRKISPFEWLYLSVSRGFPPCAVQLWISADTLPSRSSLEAALATAAESHVGVRLIPKGAWWIDSGKAPRVRYFPRSDIASLSHPVFHESFEFHDIPAVEVLYWEGAGLVFRCSHALMDAGGLLFFAQETFRALRGEPLLGTTLNKSTREYLLTLKHPHRRQWYRPDKISPIGEPLPGKSGFVWETRSIQGKISAIGTRVAASLSNLAAQRRSDKTDNTTRMMVPVDLRQLNPALRTVNNFSNAYFLHAPAASNWNEFYGQMLDALARHDERATSPVDGIFPLIPKRLVNVVNKWTHERQVRRDEYLFSGMLSHVACISLQSFSAEGFRPTSVSLLPFDVPGSAISIITTEQDDGVNIAASCPAATGSDGRLGQVLDRVCADLESGLYRSTRSAPVEYVSENGPHLDLPLGMTICTLFAAQSDISPAHIAISDATRQLTYTELDQLSIRCAAHLLKQGVLPRTNVAIIAGRSIETIAGMLGILRIGAAFVPIDIEWPEQRIQYVLNDCRPACLLVEDQYAKWAELFPSIRFSELSEASNRIDMQLPARIETESTAYIYYTSGSTGRPKGVMVQHRSLLNYVIWAKDAYLQGMNTPVVFPFFTSLSFDLTLTALFVPLVTGGAIRVFPQPDPLLAIQAILSEPSINAVKLTPSHLRLFSELGVRTCNIKKYILSGEALPTLPAQEIMAQSDNRAEIFNEYGPTEATIGCVVHRFDRERDLAGFVPIGRPIANTEVLLLDENLQLVPNGQIGEVYLSGECLALGYLARPEEEGRFQPHPFREKQRMYRTGDRALRMNDGNFDYRGRLDGQIKIRGHRVEIGEIEALIEASGLCRSCAVLQEHSANSLSLTAFVVWRAGATEEDLRATLIRYLPGYMVPSRIVGLENMPLNVNGKIDKSRLPIDLSKRAVKSLEETGSNETEREIIQMVADLTGESSMSISVSQSLLEFGLDSLQMMLLLTKAANRFLPAKSKNLLLSGAGEFLQDPTVRNLDSYIRRLICSKTNKYSRIDESKNLT